MGPDEASTLMQNSRAPISAPAKKPIPGEVPRHAVFLPDPSLHHIVIIGGWAAGLELATKLGNSLGRRRKVQITLVERARTHIWKPHLHEVAAGTLDVGRCHRLPCACIRAPLPIPYRRNDRSRPFTTA